MNTTLFIVLSISSCGGFVMGRTVLRFLTPAGGWLRKFIPYFLFAITIENKSWIGDENPLILFPFFMATFMLCYRGPWYARLITGAIFFSLLEPFCMMIDSTNMLMHASWQEALFLRLAKLLVWIILWLLARRIVPKAGSLSLSGRLWGLLGGLALAPLFSTLSFTIWGLRNFDPDMYQIVAESIAYTILPFAMLSAGALLVAIVVLSRHEELEQLQKLAEVQEVYYQGLQREQTGVRALRHDLHNHIAVARGLLETGDADGAADYLAKLSASAALTGGKQYCAHKIANALLAEKIAFAQQKGIDCDIRVSLPETLGVSDIDLCVLLGNALDNATEATEQAQEKRLSLHARADKGMLMLRVKNTLAQMPKLEKGKLVTSKKDAALHGYGVAGMQEIARKHGGACETDYTQTEFHLLISIPLEKEQ